MRVTIKPIEPWERAPCKGSSRVGRAGDTRSRGRGGAARDGGPELEVSAPATRCPRRRTTRSPRSPAPHHLRRRLSGQPMAQHRVAMPIIVDFDTPVADQAAAEQAIQISSDPPVPGKFYWMNASQVRWRHTTSGLRTRWSTSTHRDGVDVSRLGMRLSRRPITTRTR